MTKQEALDSLCREVGNYLHLVGTNALPEALLRAYRDAKKVLYTAADGYKGE